MFNLRKLRGIVCLIAITFLGFQALAASSDDIKFSLSLKEIAFSLTILNTIDIDGDEVEPFVKVQSIFANGFKQLSDKKAKADEQSEITMSRVNSQNFLLFFQRARLKGADAPTFYDITKKIIEAAKK